MSRLQVKAVLVFPDRSTILYLVLCTSHFLLHSQFDYVYVEKRHKYVASAVIYHVNKQIQMIDS